MHEITLPIIEELLAQDASLTALANDSLAPDVQGLQELELTYVGGGTYAGNLL